MRKNQNPSNSFDEYLKSVEKRESAKKRRILLLGIALCLGIAGFLVVLLLGKGLPSQSDADKISLEALDAQTVQLLLSKKPEGVVVYSDQTGLQDTIRSLTDYLNFVNFTQMALSERVELDSFTVALDTALFTALEKESEAEAETEEAPQKLEPISLEVEGTRRVGEPIRFSLDNYDPENIYLIEYGNGEVRRMPKTHEFVYTSPGEYQIKLTAINPQKNAYADLFRTVRIENAPVDRAQQEEQPDTTPDLTENLSSPQPNPSTAPPESMASRTMAPVLPETTAVRKNLAPIVTATRSQEVIADRLPEAESASEAEMPVVETESTAGPMTFAEEMPAFPGGISAMTRFLNSQLKYPALAREYEIEGIVYVQFVVKADGELEQFKVARGIGYGCDEEALRIAQKMPNWIAGEHFGKKVPVLFTIPVNFSFQ